MKAKKVLCLFLISTMFVELIGCSPKVQQVNASDGIELIEPVNAAVTTEAAEYRNLYNAVIYSSYVVPKTEEYSFAQDVTFDHYGAYPGQNISKGNELLYSNTDSIDKQLEGLEKTIENLDTSYESYVWSVDDQIEEKLYYSSLQYDDFHHIYPDENVPMNIQLTCYDVWTLRLQKQQRTAIYNLDRDYYISLQERLEKEKKGNALSSYMDGCVVSMAAYTQGSYIAKDTPVVAIGNMEEKILRCEYISHSVLSKAKRVFAIIDGVSYEIENQPIEPEEYSKLTAKGETVYSTFTFVGDTTNVNIGDYAALVMINDERIQCLSVPNSSIHKDENGNFVYVMESGTPVSHTIRTGMSDGVYTEVIEGISQGDLILIDKAPDYSTETAKVSRGDFCTNFESSGEAYYPSQTIVKNEIEYGTVYYISYEAELYQHVNKGDTIATITVSPNSIELERKCLALNRLYERKEDIVAELPKIKNGEYTDLEQSDDVVAHEIAHQVKLNQKETEDIATQITELQAEIAKIEAAYNTTKIVAPTSGIITQQAHFEDHDIIPYDSGIVVIAAEDSCFIKVDNTNQLLNCGNDVSISYYDQDRNIHTLEGTVVTLANLGISSALSGETVLVSIPAEEVSNITAALILPPGFEEYYNESWFDDWRKIFTIKSDVRQMNGVLTVPKNAVWESQGKTYVYVKKPDGSIVAQSFIAGGHDSSDYWIIDGLEEGTEVCLK